MKKDHKNQGITMIALVVTIIIMVIITGVVMGRSFQDGMVDEAANTRKEIQEYVNQTTQDEKNVLDYLN